MSDPDREEYENDVVWVDAPSIFFEGHINVSSFGDKNQDVSVLHTGTLESSADMQQWLH